MPNYQIITDLPALEEFIEWLPDPLEHEKFYLCLFARKKYCPEVKGAKRDKSQLKRFLTDKVRMLSKIKQLECELGSYTNNSENPEHIEPIPQEALALYITPTPRDLRIATLDGLANLAKLYKDGSPTINPQAEIMSTIQRTRGRKMFVTFDVDTKDPAILKELSSICPEATTVIETRGGYHFIVRPELMPKNSGQWHRQFAQYTDQSGDILCPVIGTYQGGHNPRIIQIGYSHP